MQPDAQSKKEAKVIPNPARYLLRFDDLCPTARGCGLERFLPLIEEFGLCPILAVIPDNRDPELALAEPAPEFWPRMRALEAAGATIGLHGYRHLCESAGPGLLPFHRKTEFAGVPLKIQQDWIRSGLRILRGHGLSPRIWVAPRHGFDANTLAALRLEGIPALSDGFSRVTFMRGGIAWIPQQLWAPVRKEKGLWTICIHPATATDSQVEELGSFLRATADEFISVEQVLTEMKPGDLSLPERLYEKSALLRFGARRFARGLMAQFS